MSDNKKIIYSGVSQLTAGVLGLLVVPIYVKSMGSESYGIMGILIALQAWFLLIDSLLTPALSRELGRYKGNIYSSAEVNSLFKSMEFLALVAAIIIIVIFSLISEYMAIYWINNNTELPKNLIGKSINIIGVIIAFKLLEEFYAASLIGLEEQISLAQRKIVSNVAKHVGGAIVAIFFKSIEYVLMWNVLISLGIVVTLRAKAKFILPKTVEPTRFDIELIKKLRKFSGGMLVLSIINVGITSMDKIILTKYIPLADYGYYIFGVTFASCLYFIAGPLISTYYPKFVRLVSLDDKKELMSVFDNASIKLTSFTLPVAVTVFLSADKIIEIWSQDSEIANNVFPLVKILILGTYANVLTWLPYHIQLAYGNVKSAINVNIISLIFTLVGLAVAIPIYGSIGAAWIWLFSNIILFFLYFIILRKYYMKKYAYVWLNYCVITTIIVVGIGVLIEYLMREYFITFKNNFIYIAGIFLMCLLSSLITAFAFKWLRRDLS